MRVFSIHHCFPAGASFIIKVRVLLSISPIILPRRMHHEELRVLKQFTNHSSEPPAGALSNMRVLGIHHCSQREELHQNESFQHFFAYLKKAADRLQSRSQPKSRLFFSWDFSSSSSSSSAGILPRSPQPPFLVFFNDYFTVYLRKGGLYLLWPLVGLSPCNFFTHALSWVWKAVFSFFLAKFRLFSTKKLGKFWKSLFFQV